jgi:hypothetical protein
VTHMTLWNLGGVPVPACVHECHVPSSPQGYRRHARQVACRRVVHGLRVAPPVVSRR